MRVWCDDSIQEIYARIEGRTKKDVFSTNLDISLFSRHIDVLFVVMCTKAILHAPTYEVYTHSRRGVECAFPGQVAKKRTAVVILHRGHYDLFSIFLSNKRQVLFDIGNPTDVAMRIAFAHIRQHVTRCADRPWGSVWTPTAPHPRAPKPHHPSPTPLLAPKALHFQESPQNRVSATPLSITTPHNNNQHHCMKRHYHTSRHSS